MFRGYTLRQKQVVNISTAEKIGYIRDVEINEHNGVVEAIIVPRRGALLGRFFGGGDIIIPWSAIEAVGKELVLVRLFDADFEKLS